MSEVILCKTCGIEKPIEDFYVHKKKKSGRFSSCKKCMNARTKAWFNLNRAYHLELLRKRKWALKLEAIAHYGGKCTCCGETEPKFLELDHVNNDGAKHRRKIGKWKLGADLVRWLKENNWPDFIQLLCSNCNAAKARYGICPHKEKLNG